MVRYLHLIYQALSQRFAPKPEVPSPRPYRPRLNKQAEISLLRRQARRAKG